MSNAIRKTVPLDAIKIDGGTQMRVSIDEPTVEEYAERYRDEPASMPPLEAMFDGSDYWLVDGFHRWHAMRRAGMMQVPALVTKGTATDAVWASTGANRAHGLRRTHADKRKAILAAIAVKPDESDRAIAQHVGVRHETVAAVRAYGKKDNNNATGEFRQLTAATTRLPAVAAAPEKRVGLDGRSRPAHPAPKPVQQALDAVGNPIPEHLAEQFAEARDWANQWLHQFSALTKEVRERLDGPQGADASEARAKSSVEALRFIVREQMTPHAVCPLCAGKGCKPCKNRGWHTEESWRVVPPEHRRTAAEQHERF